MRGPGSQVKKCSQEKEVINYIMMLIGQVIGVHRITFVFCSAVAISDFDKSSQWNEKGRNLQGLKKKEERNWKQGA